MEHLKIKLNEVWTLTVMKSGAYRWLKWSSLGQLCYDMATYWNVERLAWLEEDSIPVALTSVIYLNRQRSVYDQ
jgi:hypothetical protein